MKRVYICSMKELKWLLHQGKIAANNSFLLISSSYPLDMPEVAGMTYSFECYDDIDRFVLGRTFIYEGAQRFAKAVTENAHIQNWWCVCDGGQSRSAATACALLRFFGNEIGEMKIWQDPRKSPNPLVYETLCKALDVPVDAFDLDLRIYEKRTAIKHALRRGSCE